MAPRLRLWWVFVLQTVLLAGTLGGIIAAFSITGQSAVNRAVDESVKNNLLHLESSVLGYLGPIPSVAGRLVAFRAAYGLSCAPMGEANATDEDRGALFTEMGLGARMFGYIDYLYFVELMSSGHYADCSAIVSDEGALSTQYMTPEGEAVFHDCPAFPCRTGPSAPYTGNESLDIDEEAYVIAITAVTDAQPEGTWLEPTAYYEVSLDAVILSATFTIPFAFGTDGRATGAVAVDVSLNWFRGALMELRNTPSTLITVIDVASASVLSTTAAGVPPYDPEKDTAWHIAALPSAEARSQVFSAARRMGLQLGEGAANALAAAATVNRFLVSEDGSDVLSARLIVDGTLVWLAVVATPQSYYYGSSRQVMTAVTVVACIVAFILCAVSVAVWIGVVLPLRKMTAYMEQVSQLEFISMSSSGQGGNKPAIGELDGMHGAFKDMSRAIQSFTQYVPLEVVRSLMRSGEECDVRMVPARCTIMFADIAGFTSMCERIDTRSLAEVTRLYFDRMSIVVVAYGGTIDKFIGDCIMAIWGAPVPTRDANLLGSCCALRLVQETKLDPLKREFTALGFPLKIRVGVHCGDVLAGNIGCSLRLSYTVLGDAVNTAARLESLNKQFGTSVMVSEDVAASLEDYFVLRRLSRVAVVGKTEALRVYEIVGINVSHAADAKSEANVADTAVLLDVPSQGLVPREQIFEDISNPLFHPTEDELRFAAMYTEAVGHWERSRLNDCRDALREVRISFPPAFLEAYEKGLSQLWDQCDIADDTSSPLSRSNSLGQGNVSTGRVFVAVGK